MPTRYWISISALVLTFLILTMPLAFKRPTGGRSGERQAQTAAPMRAYCLDPSISPWRNPNPLFGRGTFNLEIPVFEWIQGRIAGFIDGPRCDSVESVAKVASILISATAVLIVFLIGADLWSPGAGLFAGTLVTFNELWLRYSTYTMVDNRGIVFALFALYFSLRRRPVLGGFFWTLALVQKPQVFLFFSIFWLVAELANLSSRNPAGRRRGGLIKTALGLGAGAVAGITYFALSSKTNADSDLPWVIWSGPRHLKWFFGEWDQRLEWGYWKNLGLEWIRRSGLNWAIPVAILFKPARARLSSFRRLIRGALPLLIATFGLSFIFLPVFAVHEYYVLPVNVAMALTTGGVLWVITRRPHRFFPSAVVFAILAVGLVAWPGLRGFRSYLEFAHSVEDPNAPHYDGDWDYQVFPKPNSFVVMAGPGSGRDMLHLYWTKQRGFAWCARNVEFAPRAFWKSQGVEYIAWWSHYDAKLRRSIWTVRSMGEELALARAKGWSSDGDGDDVWAGKTMAEWAALASLRDRDPCTHPDQQNPRLW